MNTKLAAKILMGILVISIIAFIFAFFIWEWEQTPPPDYDIRFTPEDVDYLYNGGEPLPLTKEEEDINRTIQIYLKAMMDSSSGGKPGGNQYISMDIDDIMGNVICNHTELEPQENPFSDTELK